MPPAFRTSCRHVARDTPPIFAIYENLEGGEITD